MTQKYNGAIGKKSPLSVFKMTGILNEVILEKRRSRNWEIGKKKPLDRSSRAGFEVEN